MGLYVYGALLMALSFAVGWSASDHVLMALSIVACGAAALSEALNDVGQSSFGIGSWPSASLWVNATAVASWFLTAAAALYAVFSLLGGA